jgi:hypothetical protein
MGVIGNMRLAHLSDEELDEIIRREWEREASEKGGEQ